MQQMLEFARDNPLHLMNDSEKQRVMKGRHELRCGVCHAIFETVHSQVSARSKTERREHDILHLFEDICEGEPDLSVPNYFNVEPPRLPPQWTDVYRPFLNRDTKRHHLRGIPKAAAKKRQEWRANVRMGKQQKQSPKDFQDDMMLTLSCRDVVEPERMAQALFVQMIACGDVVGAANSCRASLAAAIEVCKDVNGSVCASKSLLRSTENARKEL